MHLDPETLASLADGAPTAPHADAHLRACAQCREELRALRELCAQLGQAPEPPKGLHEATLQRLGLRSRRDGGLLRWGWAPALGALGLALYFHAEHPAPAELALAPSIASAPEAAAPRRQAPAALAQAAAQPAAAPAAVEPVDNASVAESQAAAPAVGLAAEPTAEAQPRVVAAPKATSTPAPEALRVAVRNNLIRPGQSLVLTVELAQAGPFRAQVLDARGRLIDTLFQGHAGPGTVYLHWDAAQAPAAVYTVLLQSGAQTKSIKAVVAH